MFDPKEDYPHTMEPFLHQRKELERRWQRPFHLLAHEQGLGKMKMGYDWALSNWRAGKVDTMIMIAPNGVHRDWICEGFTPINPESPPLVPPEWHDEIDYAYYDTNRAHTKAHQARMKELFLSKKFVVLTMTDGAVRTQANKASGWMGGANMLMKFCQKRKVALGVDESSMLQTPSAKITKILVGTGGRGGIAKHAVIRRAFEGTPVHEGPFNAYAQMQFLDQGFWKKHGFGSFKAFQTYFGIMEQGETHIGDGKTRTFQKVVAYQNLKKLGEILEPHMSRVLKRDALDLPPKIYHQMRFDMSPKQWKLYRQLEEDLWAIVKTEGSDLQAVITAELPIVLVLRLYQITCGYLPFTEDSTGEPVEGVLTFDENPRLETALQYLRGLTEKTVIWCRFRRDIDLLQSALGNSAVRYDGNVDPDQRELNKRAFLTGDAQYLIPQIQAMAKGHTLNVAPNVLYYSNDSRLRLRAQSEDRTHRGKMSHSVDYWDMVANDTVDEKRVASLRRKLKTAQAILGDEENGDDIHE